jgi:hypothetical protein
MNGEKWATVKSTSPWSGLKMFGDGAGSVGPVTQAGHGGHVDTDPPQYIQAQSNP